MSERRPLLSLYALDRPALKAFAARLKELLAADDRAALAAELGLGAELAARLGEGPRAVDWFVRPDDDPLASPLFASLRRVAKKHALEKGWSSDAASLEGRLRAFEPLRDDKAVADAIDKLLDASRLPWFLVRPGATGGWLPNDARARLARELRALRPVLTPELVAFADALEDVEGDVVAHDGL
ncbi:MAG TPA: hypothetical protein VHB21_07980 [Minicystis sp.]|nr:hypothetical protein [Minicystis sp.]